MLERKRRRKPSSETVNRPILRRFCFFFTHGIAEKINKGFQPPGLNAQRKVGKMKCMEENEKGNGEKNKDKRKMH